MDDIYKAAVRDWDWWAHWGVTQLRIGGQGHPREVVGTQKRPSRGWWVVGLAFRSVDWRGAVRVGRGGSPTFQHHVCLCLQVSVVCVTVSQPSLCSCVFGLWTFAFPVLFPSFCSELSLSLSLSLCSHTHFGPSNSASHTLTIPPAPSSPWAG